MKFYFPLHLDAGNRGCQGIAEGSARLLNVSPQSIIGYTTNCSLDKKVGLDNSVTLIPVNKVSVIKKLLRNIRMRLAKTTYEKRYIFDCYYYEDLFNMMGKEKGIMISTGGDMLCYGDNTINTTVDYCHRKGYKSILWGCSMGKENLTYEKLIALKKFDLIYTRESLSYAFFQGLGMKNVVCLPDPAFTLQAIPTTLPSCYEGQDVIGLNLSNYVLGGFDLNTSFGIQVKGAIDYLLENTHSNILLIPHVTWAKQDDRIIAQNVKAVYQGNSRVSVLDIDSLSYCQIRYLISKCRFFIGGRTHAVISAYSTCVPSIALGYSIKAKGIAKDLGLSELLVVDTKASEAGTLLCGVKYLIDNEDMIRTHLESVISEYSQKPYNIQKYLLTL